MLRYNNEYTHKLLAAEDIFFEMYEAGGNVAADCGSYLFEPDYKKQGNHAGMHINFSMHEKQKLLYDIAKTATNVLEVGTYLAHSTLIMLLANPSMTITTIDISSRFSAEPIKVLQKHFPEANINFIVGNSLDVLPTITSKHDMIHLDGWHAYDHVLKELQYCKNLMDTTKSSTSIIIDDIDGCKQIKNDAYEMFKVIKTRYKAGTNPNWLLVVDPRYGAP